MSFNDKTISIISAILGLLGGHLGGELVSSKTEINHKIVKEYFDVLREQIIFQLINILEPNPDNLPCPIREHNTSYDLRPDPFDAFLKKKTF